MVSIITRNSNIMALMESTIHPAHIQLSKLECYENLFDQLIESDSFDLDNNTAVESCSSDNWASLVGLSDSCSGTTLIRTSPPPVATIAHLKKDYLPNLCHSCVPASSPKLQLQVLEIPRREPKLRATAPTDSGRIVSLTDLDSVQNRNHPPPSALLSRRNISRSTEDTLTLGQRSLSAGVCKPAHKASTPPRMSQRQQFRTKSSDKRQRIPARSSDEADSFRPPQRPIAAAPASAPMIQTTWAPAPLHYHSYGQQPSSAQGDSNQLAFRHNALSSDQQAYEQAAYSQQSTPHAEHSGGEEISSYFQTPDTPYFGDADALGPHDFGSFSTHVTERGFPIEEMYGQQEFAGGHMGQPWWSADAAQPYSPNPAFLPSSSQSGQHAIPGPTGQSAYDTMGGGLTIKRDSDAAEANFSNTSRSQGQQQAHDSSAATPGNWKIRQDQLVEAHRRSSSPSMTSQSSRKSSSSGRPGRVPQRRSKTAGPSGRRESPSAFVNYTPEDRKKLLTGVAPSGSSKTKARRDKEAAEKQRKLRFAAAKAVLEAGGDLEALEREGLLIEKEEGGDEEEEEEEEEGSSS